MKNSSIRFIEADNAFQCRGCFERVEIPRHVDDGFKFTSAKETMEEAHAAKGCIQAMQKMDEASSRGRFGSPMAGLKLA